jgi:predicted nucleic acid-binding protein
MAIDRGEPPVYWDTSAVLSALVTDAHSRAATTRFRRPAPKLLSTLALAESLAVLARLEATSEISPADRRRASAALLAAPWLRYEEPPRRELLADLARRTLLRGADLWHLATALTAREALPELRLLTFDRALAATAEAEGLVPPTAA